jgi:hypothetical protein
VDPQLQSTEPAVELVVATIIGVRVKVKAPADALPGAVITHVEVTFPAPDMNFDLLGNRIPLHAPVRDILLATIASVAACFGPVVASMTSVARERVR